jgi:transposase, IS5 family
VIEFLNLSASNNAHVIKKACTFMYKNAPNSDQQKFLFEEEKHPFGIELNEKNRWIKLSNIIPWHQYEEDYANQFSHGVGSPALTFRTALGSLIIKETLGLSDRATVEQITENPYHQYFIGLKTFQLHEPFHHSMLSHFRKRISMELLCSLNELIVLADKNQTPEELIVAHKSEMQGEEASLPIEEPAEPENNGKLLIDATCAPSDIRYPTDLSLLDEAREKTETIIDTLWEHTEKSSDQVKPRTYRKKARVQALSVLRQKKPLKSEIRKAIRQQLEHIKRNLSTINSIKERTSLEVLSKKLYQNLLVVSELYRQQSMMYQQKQNRISDRIVSISQPHIRPIVRGKVASPVEFGAKIS